MKTLGECTLNELWEMQGVICNYGKCETCKHENSHFCFIMELFDANCIGKDTLKELVPEGVFNEEDV
jgi:hypothetical protein